MVRNMFLVYTPSSVLDNCVSITLTGISGTDNRGLFVFDGCPDTAEATCIAQSVYIGLNAPNISNLPLNIGTTYLIVVSSNNSSNCHNFNITVGAGVCAASDTGATCSNAHTIITLPFTSNGLTTCGAGNDYNQGNITCNNTYTDGEDYIFEYIPASNECIAITLSNTLTYTGLFVLNGCPDDARDFSPGIYPYSITIGDRRVTRKMVILN